jgi:hypothetical protein
VAKADKLEKLMNEVGAKIVHIVDVSTMNNDVDDESVELELSTTLEFLFLH